jgi:hypothetical protein
MSSVPDEYICPITQAVMVDPVSGSDGRTYERSAIVEWLRTHNTSPITREIMTAGSLKPNYALRSLIQRYNTIPQVTIPQVTIPQVTIPQVTVVPVQPPSQVDMDHYYALEVFQQETVGHTSISVSKRPVVQTPAQKRMAILCGVVALIIILALFIHFL